MEYMNHGTSTCIIMIYQYKIPSSDMGSDQLYVHCRKCTRELGKWAKDLHGTSEQDYRSFCCLFTVHLISTSFSNRL